MHVRVSRLPEMVVTHSRSRALTSTSSKAPARVGTGRGVHLDSASGARWLREDEGGSFSI